VGVPVMPRGRQPGQRVGPNRHAYIGHAAKWTRRQRRIDAGLTQLDLAQLASVAERTVRDWERNKTLRAANLRRIEDVIERAAAVARAGQERVTLAVASNRVGRDALALASVYDWAVRLRLARERAARKAAKQTGDAGTLAEH
jgi:transcriptional regulator with XRE-family HTH domain